MSVEGVRRRFVNLLVENRDDASAKVVEHWYNPKNAAYYNVIPVKFLRLDVEKDGFTYTTYKLAFATMGGPSGSPRARQRGARAGARTDARFRVPRGALHAGYLTDKAGEKIVADLWKCRTSSRRDG